jgi:hypothetical protein
MVCLTGASNRPGGVRAEAFEPVAYRGARSILANEIGGGGVSVSTAI